MVISSLGWRLSTKGVCSNGAYRYKTLCKTATPAPPAIQVTHSCSPLCIPVQDGDTYPDFPEDGDLPEGEAEVKARIEAATSIKGRGNDLFKQVRGATRGRGGDGTGLLTSTSRRWCHSSSGLPAGCGAGRLGAGGYWSDIQNVKGVK